MQNLGLILDVQILPSSYLGDKTDVTLFQNLGAHSNFDPQALDMFTKSRGMRVCAFFGS